MRAGDLIADRFEVELLAGSGGVGQVYRARDRLNGSPIALKVLRLPSARDTERFAREARVLARLRHPSIVRYVAHGKTPGGEPYMAMEWLDGEDLASRLAREPLTLAESAAVVRRAAEALAAAHAHGIVHRDIKPSNLFLRDGRLDDLKLLDFGLAWLVDASRELTREGLVVGTLGYMAPEQAVGDRAIDARTDVFALGCVLYRCVTGRAPFDCDRIGAMLMKILHDDPPRLSQLVPEAPAELAELVSRMLAKDPAARPADGGAVAAALGALLPLLPVSIDRPAPPPPAITHVERRLACFVAVGKPSDWLSPASSRLLVLWDVGSDRIERAREIAERHGGQLEALADGALLVALGVAASATDLASQAARCALELRALLPSAPIAVAMGRSDQSTSRFEGAAIDVAAEMLSAAAGAWEGEAPPIRVDATSATLLDPAFELDADAIGSVLLGERPAAERPRLLLGKPTPCVGRERELSTLRGVFEECVAERVARTALVTGPPGCGKSRVRRELLRALRERRDGAEIWMAAGQPLSSGTPFALAAAIVRAAARLSPDDAPAARRLKLAARVQRHLGREQAARVAAFLGELVEARSGEEGEGCAALRAASADPALMTDQIRRAWLDFLAAECAAQPVVLALEDLHWADAPSVALVSTAVRRLHELPLLVLGCARPEAHDLFPRLAREPSVQEIRLGELTPRACERLLRAVAGDALDRAQIAAIVERSGGNPFYLEELLRAAVAGGTSALPDTVLAMVQARLLSLDPAARRVLRAASVFGPRFHIAGVRALLGQADTSDVLSHWIDVLVEAELIEHPSGAWDDDGEMAFRSALVREAVYETLADHDRRLGHRLAGAWLEESDQADAATVARHFTLGGERDRAVAWHLAAAEAAVAGARFEAALSEAQQGIDCGASGELLGALRAARAHALALTGDLPKAEAHAREALALLPAGGARWCQTSGTAAILAVLGKRGEDLVEIGDAVLAKGPADGAIEAHVIALAATAIALLRAGMFDRAGSFFDRIAHQAPRLLDERSSAEGWIELARAYRAGFLEADPWGQREHALAVVAGPELVRDVRSWGYALVQAAAALSAMGGHAEAATKLREAIAKLDQAGVVMISALARAELALALAHIGRTGEARAELASALRASTSMRAAHVELVVRRVGVQVMLLTGDLGAAEEEARALEPCRCARDPAPCDGLSHTLPEIEAAVALAQLHAAAGRSAEALSLTTDAMRWLEARGSAGPIEATLRLLHAEALSATGQPEAAAAALAQARERLLARASRIADPARRASFLSQVPENRRTLSTVR